MKSLMQFKVPSHTCNPEELKETQCVMIDISNKKKQLCEKLTSFLILVVSSAFVYLKTNYQDQILYFKFSDHKICF
jgi:hypothetical protein